MSFVTFLHLTLAALVTPSDTLAFFAAWALTLLVTFVVLSIGASIVGGVRDDVRIYRANQAHLRRMAAAHQAHLDAQAYAKRVPANPFI